MQTVGFVTSPLSDANAVRGVGFYTRRLLDSMTPLAEGFDLKILPLDRMDAKSFACDLIHLPYFHPYFLTLPAHPPRPLAVTIHDIIPLQFPRHYPPGITGTINLFLQKQRLRQVAAVLTDAYASVGPLHTRLGIPHSKMKFIHLAADAAFHPLSDRRMLASVRRKYSLPDQFVLYVGDVNWNKNIPGLTSAAAIAGLPLVIVGRQAAEVDKMDLRHPELIHLSGWLKDISRRKIYRLGFVPTADLAVLYNLATVYCQPSFAEGFGLSVLEAMACGTPVAASDIPVLKEVAGDSAVYFDPASVSDMASVLNRFRTDRSLRDRLSLLGLAQSAKFSWDRTAQNTLLVYRQLLMQVK